MLVAASNHFLIHTNINYININTGMKYKRVEIWAIELIVVTMNTDIGANIKYSQHSNVNTNGPNGISISMLV